jgi:hypothetical protein
VEFNREDDHLRYTSRIGRPPRILAEGPTGIVNVSNGLTAASDKIEEAFVKIIEFIDDNEPLIRREVRLPPEVALGS